MAESNALKLVDTLKSPIGPRRQSAVKKNAETATLGKIYNFLVKDREEKNKRQVELNRIQQESTFEQQFTTTPSTDVATSTATVTPKKDKDGGMFGGLGLLGIVAVGAGAFIFSKEIREKIDEMKMYFEESTWMDAFDKFKELFDFSDLLDEMGLGPIPEVVERGAEISGFNEGDLNILTQGGKILLNEEEFKQIQSKHKELEGKTFTDIEANIAAQGFKAKDIQSQLGTTDITQTYAAEKLGVESTKKLYAAKETESAAKLLPESAQTQRELFYKPTGEERTVGEVREMISTQSKPPSTGGQREVQRKTKASAGTTQFVKEIYPHAKKAAQELNVPVEAIVGQAIQESGGGKFVHNYNLFNQTAGKNWKGDVVSRGDTNAAGQKITQKFKAYNSYGEAFDDYVAYIKRRQKQAIGATSAYDYGAALKSGGYAEDPGYAQHIAQGAATAAGIIGQMSESEKSASTNQTVGGYSPLSPEQMQQNTGSASGLDFAPGVDTRISDVVSGKMKQVQSIFGKKLTITSGYRDPSRNEKVGGAKNSAHLRGDAVDVSTNGMSVEDKLRLIQIASAVGIGGIGVYSGGGLHFDIEGRRAWGDNYHLNTLPEWASSVITGHLQGSYLGNVPTSEPTTQLAAISAPPSPIPTQERKPTSRGGNTIIVSQNQVSVAAKKVTKVFDNGYKDMTPQDILNGAVRV